LVDKEADYETYYLNSFELPSDIPSERRMLMEDEKVQTDHWNVKLFPNPANNNFFPRCVKTSAGRLVTIK